MGLRDTEETNNVVSLMIWEARIPFLRPMGSVEVPNFANHTMTSYLASVVFFAFFWSASRNMSMATLVLTKLSVNACTSVDATGVLPGPYVQCRSRFTCFKLWIWMGITPLSTWMCGNACTGAVSGPGGYCHVTENSGAVLSVAYV